MKPRRSVAEARTAAGRRLVLSEQDGAWAISLDGQELMHSRAHASELALAEVGWADLGTAAPRRVLIGGLGLGFTLRRMLELAGPDTVVEVAELVPAVVAWNREHLRELNGACLDDARVVVREGDVAAMIRQAPRGRYDLLLLDVDNGPVAMVAAGNASLYAAAGLRAVRRALRPGGRVVFWSAGPDEAFAARLRQVGFAVEAIPAKVHANAKRAAYMLYAASAG
ncbi:spermidine synthase [Actomonas aquatica]|uniref:PABS domain-containing protein n=1 Tax=Actomonas aquatica TaxID=2866162 RepID=A0ABZ1C2D9_9BACT|nr:hypothetical protein [Opitutus sp. WL0086]WRQ85872.1 hypothetical protein K1X11_013750 [Opitutus sp. WL0086]